jgi:hypothetical protein
VGKHTCLKVFASQQLGEISGGNNSAQENVFDFEAAAFSPPAPVVLSVAVRNPRDQPVIATMSLKQVPQGYQVQFPHAWVHLDAHEERRFDLVVIPTWDVSAYIGKQTEAPSTAPVLIHGFLGRQYSIPLTTGELPASRFSFMGGILANVTPKRETAIEITEDQEKSEEAAIAIRGWVANAHDGDAVRVTTIDDATGASSVVETVTDANGEFWSLTDLRELARLAGRDPDAVAGTYTVFAETFVAATVVEATSPSLLVYR